MKNRLLKVAITSALTVAFAVPAFANPFSDVPAKHWSYDAVAKLAQAGVIEGYEDGTFKGEKTVTRYEMAQMVAKAMNKSLNSDQQGTVDQLSKEFATELNTLGVKVEKLQDQMDNAVKISGDARVRYSNQKNTDDNTDFRARVTFDGKVNDNLKFNARLSSGNMNYDGKAGDAEISTANVTFDALGLTNTLGRQDVLLAGGELFDDQLNAFTTEVAGLKLVAGNINVDNENGDTEKSRIYAAEYGFNALGADFAADYFKNDTIDQEIYGISTAFNVANGIDLNASYYDNHNDKADAVSYGVKLTKLGLSATYRNVEAGAYTGFGSMESGFSDKVLADGFKGMEYRYDRALAKNTTLNVKYQDFKDQDGFALDDRTQATINVKF